jgi:ABC-2 type transport system ATP-binding protein
MANQKTVPIKIDNLSKDYRTGFFLKRVRVLGDLSLEVREGEVFGFLGPNGAGKTTTLKILMGLVYPSEGSACIWGEACTRVSVRRNVGYLPESPYFYDYLTGWELMAFYAKLYGLSDPKDRIEALMQLVGLGKTADLQLRKYSKGMLQRIGLAQALVHDPPLVILDEPMSGLDPIGRKEIRDILFRLKDRGKTVFFSTHILSDAEAICDRVGIIVGGKLRSVGALNELVSLKVRAFEVTFKNVGKESLEKARAFCSRLVEKEDQVFAWAENEEKLQSLVDLIRSEGGILLSLVPRKETLEDVFMHEIQRGKDA